MISGRLLLSAAAKLPYTSCLTATVVAIPSVGRRSRQAHNDACRAEPLASSTRGSSRAVNKPVVSKQMTDELYSYILDNTHEHQVLGELRDETSTLPMSKAQIAPEQGRFMAWLVKTMGIKRAVEIGVFTGYSSVAVAMALPEDGTLVAIDREEKTMEIARKYWKLAGVSSKVVGRVGMGVTELERLLEEEGEGSFDFIFIDADKRSYDAYYELSLKLARVGGIVAVDNTLWWGRVADPMVNDKATIAIRALNEKIVQDTRVFSTMLQIADGFTLCTKL